MPVRRRVVDGRPGLTGIVDCDHLPVAPRGYDLGYYLAFAVHWWLDHDQAARPVDEARQVVAGYQGAFPLSRPETDDLPALALVTTLGLIDYFIREHDLVEDSWLRTAGWIDDHFTELAAAPGS
jgi:Ser/Thr protein kinase RdoA (MazF antagonist)